jgi:hypothetical protein
MCSNLTSILRIDRLWYHCWGSTQITKKIPTEPWIAQIYLSSYAVTINRDSDTYPRRPNAGITLPHKCWWWSQRSRPQGREGLDVRMPRRHGAMTPVWEYRRTDIVPHVQYLIVLAHVRHTMTPSGSSPAEQRKKKYLDWKSGSLTVSRMWSIL